VSDSFLCIVGDELLQLGFGDFMILVRRACSQVGGREGVLEGKIGLGPCREIASLQGFRLTKQLVAELSRAIDRYERQSSACLFQALRELIRLAL
jgi:hypothetical protein